MKKVIIIGAGPSGLTAAYELLKEGGYDVTVLEATDDIGGISKTVEHNGNRMDIGGHRFFSKDDSVMKWWSDIMPVQGRPSKDDALLGKDKPFVSGGPDPEKDDNVMLLRERVSRILYLRKFFDYPISLKPATFINMGFTKTVKAGFGYMKSAVFKRKPEKSLEDFMINRFGRPLYEMFFKDYTEKVWGVAPDKISASWGAQRIKGLSLRKALKNALLSPFTKNKSQKTKETSLIESFWYPKYGPGQLWERVASLCEEKGAKIIKNAEVVGLITSGGTVRGVRFRKGGAVTERAADVVISSMPVKDLVNAFDCDVPEDVKRIADGLVYRDFITVGLSVDKLDLENKTKIKTVGDIVPDTWIYVQEKDVKVGRLQIFNNWSPYLVKDFGEKVWIGLEYFVNEGDGMWNMSDEDFIAFAEDELCKLGIIRKENIRDSVRFKIKKAYPAYFGTYGEFDTVKNWLCGFDNLYCIGRNGQHRYNNMDHSMLTAFAAAKAIKEGFGKDAVWDINVEESYHESKEGN